MLPVGALCFYQAHFGRTVLLKWPFWAHLFYSVFYIVSKFCRACFRQERVAQATLPPGALFTCKGLCAASLRIQIPHVPAPTFGLFLSFLTETDQKLTKNRPKVSLLQGLQKCCREILS